MPKNDKIDVAFSFLTQDEEVAHLINELIKDRVKTFIYYEHQEELAGREGMENFSKIFEKKASIVVVLLRKEWGNIGFTQVEMTAIQNRWHDCGNWDFIFPIVVADEDDIPGWLPKTKLWYDLDRFGAEGAASAIEAKIKEIGIILKKATAVELGIRRHRSLQSKIKRKSFLNSPEGVKAGDDEAHKLFDAIEETVGEMKKSDGEIITSNQGNTFVRIDYGDYALVVNWVRRCSVSIEDGRLLVRVSRKGWDEDEINRVSFLFDCNLVGTCGWKEEYGSSIFRNTELMVLRSFEIFFDTIDKDHNHT